MMVICELCGKEITKNPVKHHLKPHSLNGGKPNKRITLHYRCHVAIHAIFTLDELYQEYNTLEKLQKSMWIQVYMWWIRDKRLKFLSSKQAMKRKTLFKEFGMSYN